MGIQQLETAEYGVLGCCGGWHINIIGILSVELSEPFRGK
jgi:hypothetical protein